MSTEIIQVPYNFNPRSYQIAPFNAIADGYRRVAFCMHRRAGKDLICWNVMGKEAMKRRGTYLYMFPYYKQARIALWEAYRSDGFRIRDHIHPSLVVREENQQMLLELKNGSIVRLCGSDNIDSIVGSNPIGVVFSEFSLHKPSAYNYLRPIVNENKGWMMFQGTPRGKNHFWKLANHAKRSDKWFWASYDVTQTRRHNGQPVITLADIEEERLGGMPEELIQQEYYCSWDAGLVGAYFADLMQKAAEQGRIRPCPHDPNTPVVTAWDLGRNDTNVIIFAQHTGRETRILDVISGSNKGGEEYARHVLERKYIYSNHFMPHDVEVHEYMSNTTRRETFEDLGLDNIITIPRMGWSGDGLAENHHIIRKQIPLTYFNDTVNVEDLVEGLKSYRREWDEKNNCFRETYVHDWASHYARAFNSLAMGLMIYGVSMEKHLQERAIQDYNELDPYLPAEQYTDPRNFSFGELNNYGGM